MRTMTIPPQHHPMRPYLEGLDDARLADYADHAAESYNLDLVRACHFVRDVRAAALRSQPAVAA